MQYRSLSIRLYRQEEHPLAFVTGAACLSLLVFLLCVVGAARQGVFLAAGLAILGLAFRLGAHRPEGDSLPPLPPLWKWLFRSIFSVFFLASIWAAEASNRALLVPLGLVAGFGYAAKYTAFLAVPYALAVVGWKSFRRGKPVLKPLAIVAGCAGLMIAPWMIKNAVWF